MRNSQDVGILWRGWISTGAFEQDQIITPRFAGCPYRLLQLGDCRPAGGDNERFAGCGNTTDQGQVSVLERGDLVAGHIQTLEKIYRRVIEWGAERNDAELARTIKDWLVPLPRGVGLAIQFVY